MKLYYNPWPTRQESPIYNNNMDNSECGFRFCRGSESNLIYPICSRERGGVVPSNPFRQWRTFRAQPSQCMYTLNTISGGGGGGGSGSSGFESSGFFSSPPPSGGCAGGGLSCLSSLFDSGAFLSSSAFFSPSAGFFFSWTNTKSVWARSCNKQENGYRMRRRETKKRDLSHWLWSWVSLFSVLKNVWVSEAFLFFYWFSGCYLFWAWLNVYGSGKWRAKQGQIRGCPSSSTLPPPTMTWLFIGEHVHRRWGLASYTWPLHPYSIAQTPFPYL